MTGIDSGPEPIPQPVAGARTITVVSGLPRSGTSLMMQMLEAAGLPLAIDGQRKPDADNPRGYYELEAVKAIRRDPTFLTDAVGRAVKIVAPLLLALPQSHDYRILFMERDLDEVLASQRAMLVRRGGASAASNETEDAAMRRAWSHQLRAVEAWLSRQPRASVCFVSYRSLGEAPERVCAEVAAFLAKNGPSLAANASRRMAEVVDPTLYRQRVSD